MAIRRVVTGTDSAGTSRVVSDGEPPCGLPRDSSLGVEVTYIWATESLPLAPNRGDDPTRPDLEFYPPPHGSRFIVNAFPPGFGAQPADPAKEGENQRSFDHLLMHTTATVDYGIVLQGEVTLVLGSGEEVALHPLDVVVQNGTDHGWRNNGSEVAVVGFVMLGC